jgi:hypothetical protein
MTMASELGTSMHDWPILTSLVCIFIVCRVVKFLTSNKVDHFHNVMQHMTSNLSKDGQGDSGPMGAIFTSHASRCRPPYMLVEPRYRLDLGMALVLYVQPIHLTRFFSDNPAVYKKWGSEFVSFVPFLGGPTLIFTSSLEVSRQILTGGSHLMWVKPKWSMKGLE